MNFQFTPRDKERLQELDKLLNTVPLDASIGTDTFIIPHLGMHANITVFNLDNIEPEYLIFFDPNMAFPDRLEYLKNKRGYKIIRREGGFQLLKLST